MIVKADIQVLGDGDGLDHSQTRRAPSAVHNTSAGVRSPHHHYVMVSHHVMAPHYVTVSHYVIVSHYVMAPHYVMVSHYVMMSHASHGDFVGGSTQTTPSWGRKTLGT